MALGKKYGTPLSLAYGSRVGLTNIMWQSQSGGQWCWAACTSMVLQGLGHVQGQCAVAGKILKGKCAKTPCSKYDEAHPDCDVAYPVKYIEALWEKFKIKAVPTMSAVGWSDVWRELNAGHPIEIFLGVSNERGEAGHLVLLIDAVVDSMGTRVVLVADPASKTYEVSPKEFESLRARLNWGPWAWTWTGL